MLYEYYQKNPSALIELRAPIFEDKVVEHIVQQAKPIDRKVSVQELLQPIGDGEQFIGGSPIAATSLSHEHGGHDHDHAHDHAHDHPHGPGEHGHDHAHDHDPS
jgi:trigger factor